MNLDNITTQPFILSLFKRDDGVRFLLGSGAYEFKNSQLHFVANAFMNDVVEVQGNDGALLAGQVRRARVQPFDGYVGDGSTIKSKVEQYRTNFMKFFQKNHFYTVIYIFPDGSAIQRRRGYIVDAPEVKELYQTAPEYHIAFNFEDVNYYKYSENDEGEETYSNLAEILSSITVAGGLVWDNSGSTTETKTKTGTNITLDYSTDDGFDDVEIYGDTEQETISGKNLLPVPTTGSITSNNITTTYNSDGGMAVSGTSSTTWCNIKNWAGLASNTIPAGTYTISAFRSSNIQVQITLYEGSTAHNYFIQGGSTSTTITTTFATTATVLGLASLTQGQTVNDTIRVQIEAGSTSTSYEPFCGGTASPNPSYPQIIQTVTGEQTITIADGGSQSQNYTVDLGSIELCKIGDYQDYIYKDNGDWYIHKETGKHIVVSNEPSIAWDSMRRRLTFLPTGWGIVPSTSSADVIKAVSDMFIAGSTDYVATNLNNGMCLSTGGYISLRFGEWTSQSDALSQAVGAKIYYALETPTDTQITDATLISQLEALLGADTYTGGTNVVISGNLTGTLSITYTSEIVSGGGVEWDNYGAIWEEGGGGGQTIITVDSITNVLPTIRITGPATDPILTNITTGQAIKYYGNVLASQTLVIDVNEKTAKLNGTSVIQNVDGDWLQLAPGNNRMEYTVDNAEQVSATIEWQEIVG